MGVFKGEYRSFFTGLNGYAFVTPPYTAYAVKSYPFTHIADYLESIRNGGSFPSSLPCPSIEGGGFLSLDYFTVAESNVIYEVGPSWSSASDEMRIRALDLAIDLFTKKIEGGIYTYSNTTYSSGTDTVIRGHIVKIKANTPLIITRGPNYNWFSFPYDEDVTAENCGILKTNPKGINLRSPSFLDIGDSIAQVFYASENKSCFIDFVYSVP